MITGYGTREEEKETLLYGVEAFISKIFRLDKLIQSLKSGEAIHLRMGALPDVKIRNWAFKEKNSLAIILTHKEEGYLLAVGEDDIDWAGYEKTRKKIIPKIIPLPASLQ